MRHTNTLTLEGFGAMRRGHALAAPLNVDVAPGTVLGVVGPNGVGKSSLLAAVAGAGVPSFGSVRFAGEDLMAMGAKRRARTISMLAQETGAPNELRVHELVSIGALAGGRTNVQRAVNDALYAVGVHGLGQRQIGELSGGERQLVQIARVLAQNTPIVIFDEPTAALDLYHQKVVEQTMRRLGNDGKIVIAALHDLSLALNACTMVMLLDRQGGSHTGHPSDILRADLVHLAYGVHTAIHTAPDGQRYLTASAPEGRPLTPHPTWTERNIPL